MAAPDEELDLDPIEPAQSTPNEPKAKKSKGRSEQKAEPQEPDGGKSDRNKTEKGKANKQKIDRDDEDGESSPRELKVGDRKVPYPVSPADIPEGLTDYPDSYTQQQNLLLAGLFVFLVFYIGAILFFALIGAWCIWSLGHLLPIKIVGIVFSGIFFLFLVKGFFKRHAMNKEMHIEIMEEEHPLLFVFIAHLCDELGAPLPNKVYVSPDVNAAVMPRTSLINLFVEPKKDLLIGLGLVNSVNLSEFKAVLAHEFGHFSQSAVASSYTYVAHRIIADLVEGEDWFDRLVNWCKAQHKGVAWIGYTIGAPLWLGRKVLEWFYKAITLQRLAVSREREFHADLVAVSAAGSNAVVHCLLRTDFGHQCFMQALNDMATALDHKLYSNDMYLHQDRAAVIVRRKKKEPQLGLPPLLKVPTDGKDIEVFDAEEEEMEDEIPPMWRTHPSNSDREKNVKEEFVPAVVDHRSPWILFDESAELRERMTYKFYRMVFRIPKNSDLAEAVKVQKFIDNEHADTTYDQKYKGAYDDRPLEPGELSELNEIIRDKPWDEERMEKVLAKLYADCEEHAEAHSDLYKEMQALRSGVVGRPSAKMKRKMEELEDKQDENWEWFKSFDRRVYLLHVQMAAQVDRDLKGELIERYRFQLEVQRLYQESRAAFNNAENYLGAYHAAARGEIQVAPDFPGEVIQILRESWKTLRKIIKDAREINLPAMKNFEEGDNLAEFILEGKMVPEPPLTYVKGLWIDKLMTQLQGVRQKCFRLHFKSVGGILRIQEQIAERWTALREPVSAEVVEVIPAEIIPAEPISEEIIPAEIIPAEIIAEGPLSGLQPIAPAESSLPPVTSAPELEPTMMMAALSPTSGSTPSTPGAPEWHLPDPAVPPLISAPTLPSAGAEGARIAGPLDVTAEMEPLPAGPMGVSNQPQIIIPPSVAPNVPAEEIFSLNTGDAPPQPITSPNPTATEPTADSLEAAGPKPTTPSSGVIPTTATRSTIPIVPAPALSGVTEMPVARTVSGSDAGPPTSRVKPASGSRPPIKITMVKPGEVSPLQKG